MFDRIPFRSAIPITFSLRDEIGVVYTNSRKTIFLKEKSNFGSEIRGFSKSDNDCALILPIFYHVVYDTFDKFVTFVQQIIHDV